MIVPMTARAGDRHADADASAAASLRLRTTCSWPRTSGCAPAPRWRTRGSTARPRRSRARCRPRCCRRVLPDVPGATLAAAFHPAGQGLEVGGDFYDVFTTGEGQWYLVIGDVCGQGRRGRRGDRAGALHAAHGGRARGARPRRSCAGSARRCSTRTPPAGASARSPARTSTSPRSPARLTVSCGGHPLPALRRADGTVEPVGAPGTLLGLLADPELQDRIDRAAPGRHARALHRRADRGARAAATWSFEELAAAVRAAPDGRAGRAWSTSLVASALGDRARPRDDLAVLALKFDARPGRRCGRRWPCRRRCQVLLALTALSSRCGVPSAGVSSTSGGCSSGYPISDSVVSIPGLLPPIGDVASRVRDVPTPDAVQLPVPTRRRRARPGPRGARGVRPDPLAGRARGPAAGRLRTGDQQRQVRPQAADHAGARDRATTESSRAR